MTQVLLVGLALLLVIAWAFMLRGPFLIARECLLGRRFLTVFQAASDVHELSARSPNGGQVGGAFSDVFVAAVTILEVQLERAPNEHVMAVEAACRKARRVARRSLNRLQQQQAPLLMFAARGPYYALGSFVAGLLWSVVAPHVFESGVIWQLSLALCLVGLSLAVATFFVIPAVVIAPIMLRLERTLRSRLDSFVVELGHRLQNWAAETQSKR